MTSLSSRLESSLLNSARNKKSQTKKPKAKERDLGVKALVTARCLAVVLNSSRTIQIRRLPTRPCLRTNVVNWTLKSKALREIPGRIPIDTAILFSFSVSAMICRKQLLLHRSASQRNDLMILLLNIARGLMVLWIAYGLLLIFAPSVVHSSPNQTSGAIQALAAFAIGYLLDRILSVVLRRKADQVDKLTS
jgi:hypothetical protein